MHYSFHWFWVSSKVLLLLAMTTLTLFYYSFLYHNHTPDLLNKLFLNKSTTLQHNGNSHKLHNSPKPYPCKACRELEIHCPISAEATQVIHAIPNLIVQIATCDKMFNNCVAFALFKQVNRKSNIILLSTYSFIKIVYENRIFRSTVN